MEAENDQVLGQPIYNFQHHEMKKYLQHIPLLKQIFTPEVQRPLK